MTLTFIGFNFFFNFSEKFLDLENYREITLFWVKNLFYFLVIILYLNLYFRLV